MEKDDEEDGPALPFTDCRRTLQGLIGRSLLDITGADPEDTEPMVCFMFDDGSMLTVRSGDGTALPFKLEGPAVDRSEG